MMEIICNNRLGKEMRIKCESEDTIGELKKLIASQAGTSSEKVILKKWHEVYTDSNTLLDCEIQDGMRVELYYN